MIPHLIPHNRPTIDAADIEAVSRVLASGQIAQGAQVRAFEEELCARFRPEGDAVAVSSGTAALYLALRSLGVGPRGPHCAHEVHARVTRAPGAGAPSGASTLPVTPIPRSSVMYRSIRSTWHATGRGI